MGLLAYFMLTNSLPFEGRTTDKILTSVIISSGRVKVNPSAISGAAPQAEQLAQIVNECLAKQASGRPKNLSSLKNALLAARAVGGGHVAQSSQGLESLSSLSLPSTPSLGTSGLGGPNLTPNHSLMNSLGFGQTLGFDASPSRRCSSLSTLLNPHRLHPRVPPNERQVRIERLLQPLQRALL